MHTSPHLLQQAGEQEDVHQPKQRQAAGKRQHSCVPFPATTVWSLYSRQHLERSTNPQLNSPSKIL